MRARIIIALFLILAATGAIHAQHLNKPKKIKVEGDFKHHPTGVIFPVAIGNYTRTEMTTFNREWTDISAEYSYVTEEGKTQLSIYVFPVSSPSDYALRQNYDYVKIALNYAAAKHNDYHEKLCTIKKYGYTVHGFHNEFRNGKTQELVRLYLCGLWYFKIRITSYSQNAAQLSQSSDEVVDVIDPVKMVKDFPLNPVTDINISPKAFSDSGLFYIAMVQAFEKLSWTCKKVDSMERLSGVPDIYLDEYVTMLSNTLKSIDTSKTVPRTEYLQKYTKQLRTMISSGFLDEHIMNRFDRLMIVAEGMKLDYDAYDKWLLDNQVNLVNPDERLFILVSKSAQKAEENE